MRPPIDRAYCAFGHHLIGDGDYFYTVNPEGGYGLREVLCCEACIRKPENAEVRRRMIEIAGCTELESPPIREPEGNG